MPYEKLVTICSNEGFNSLDRLLIWTFLQSSILQLFEISINSRRNSCWCFDLYIIFVIIKLLYNFFSNYDLLIRPTWWHGNSSSCISWKMILLLIWKSACYIYRKFIIIYFYTIQILSSCSLGLSKGSLRRVVFYFCIWFKSYIHFRFHERLIKRIICSWLFFAKGKLFAYITFSFQNFLNFEMILWYIFLI